MEKEHDGVAHGAQLQHLRRLRGAIVGRKIDAQRPRCSIGHVQIVIPPEHRVQDVRRPTDASRFLRVLGARVFERMNIEARSVRGLGTRALGRFGGASTTGNGQQHTGHEQRFERLTPVAFHGCAHEAPPLRRLGITRSPLAPCRSYVPGSTARMSRPGSSSAGRAGEPDAHGTASAGPDLWIHRMTCSFIATLLLSPCTARGSRPS